MKYRYIYTVTREYNSEDSLEEEKESFLGVQDEAGEYLYGGSGSSDKETIKVRMEQFIDGKWKKC